MKIVRVEPREVDQPRQILDHDVFALVIEQTPVSELLQAAIDVHERQAGRVADFVLSERKLVAVVSDEPPHPQPRQQFAQQVTAVRHRADRR